MLLRGLRTVVALVALSAVIVAGAQAGGSRSSSDGKISGSATSASGQDVSPQMVISPNWSGYVATAPASKEKVAYGHPYFTSVTGTWTVPVAKCTAYKPKASKQAYSTVWIGLGGWATRNQEEVGTDSNCTAKGKPFYYAWFELVPYLSYKTFPNIKLKVEPGDTMTGLVQIVSTRLVELKIVDVTRHWTFMKKINFTSQDSTTADWIVEAPAECRDINCTEASLANFGAVTMRNISATAHGKAGNLKDSRWKVLPVKLVPSKLIVPTINPTATGAGPGGKKGQAASPAGATPGAVSKDGTSFNLHWVKVATNGL